MSKHQSNKIKWITLASTALILILLSLLFVNGEQIQGSLRDLQGLFPKNKPPCTKIIPIQINQTDTFNLKQSINPSLNLIFVGSYFKDIDKFKALVIKLLDVNGNGYQISTSETSNWYKQVYGFFGVEPFKSNKNNFKAAYSASILQSESVPETTLCNVNNAIIIHLLDTNAPSYGVAFAKPNSLYGTPEIYGTVTLYTKTSQGEDMGNQIVFQLMHEMAHVFDITHFDVAGSNFPSNAPTYDEAKSWWKNLIGYGCGQPGIHDCNSDCYEKKSCGIWDYETEVGIFTNRENLCFDSNNNPLSDCNVVLQRKTFDPSTLIRNISFKASYKDDCANNEQNCLYFENGNYNFKNKQYQESFICNNSPNIMTTSGNTAYYSCADQNGNFRPQIHGSMTGAKYNYVYIQFICEKIKKTLGNTAGICLKLPSL